MALSRVKTWSTGEVLTANDLNNEFNNITNNALVEPFVATQQVDLNGQLLILDADGNTLLDASTDNVVDVTIGGADDFRFAANTFTALSGSSVVVESGALTITSGTLNVVDGQTTLADPDSRTNTVATPLIVTAETSGTPAAGIGTGILIKAESGDEAPSNFGQLDFSASDVTAGSEDTFFRVWLRVAGAALTECWRWVATGAFKGIFTHANTADRTYTLPNHDWDFTTGTVFRGPLSVGSGSTRSHEGAVTVSSNGNYSGIHYYTDFTLNSGVTMTIPAGSGRLVLIASGTITINGTITGAGAGVYANPSAGTTSLPGTAQPGGGSGDLVEGGPVYRHGIRMARGGVFGSLAGTTQSGSSYPCGFPGDCVGGATGAPSANVAGGAGGASITLVAPTIVLGSTATLNTSGSNGGNDASYGGGGGGAGNVYIFARSFTDNGATFTQTGGAGGTGGTGNGGSGAAGVKQINLYQ